MTAPKIVRTQRALAVACGTSRTTIGGWLKLDGNPGRRADGSFSVSRWQKWVSENGLGSRTGRTENNPILDPLRREKLKLQSEKIALETVAAALQNAVSRGEKVRLDKAKQVIGNAWGSMIQQLRQTKHRISAQVCGLDSGAAEKVLRADLLESLRRFEIPEGLEKHAFFGPIRAQLEALHAVFQEDGL